MEQVSSDKEAGLPEVWQTYQTLIKSAVGRDVSGISMLLKECCKAALIRSLLVYSAVAKHDTKLTNISIGPRWHVTGISKTFDCLYRCFSVIIVLS